MTLGTVPSTYADIIPESQIRYNTISPRRLHLQLLHHIPLEIDAGEDLELAKS